MPMPLVEPVVGCDAEVEGDVAVVDGAVVDVDGDVTDVAGTEVAGAELPGIVPSDPVDDCAVEEEDRRAELSLAPVLWLELPELTSNKIKPNKSKKSTPMHTISNMEWLSL